MEKAEHPLGARGQGPGAAQLSLSAPTGARFRLPSGISDAVSLRNTMLDASVDCIKVIAVDGTLIHMNRSGCLALGVPVGESRFGMPWLERLPKEVRRRGRRALDQARRGRKARFAGMSILPGEKPQYWDNILTPVTDDEGRTVVILCVSRDVTLQREAERRLRLASETDSLTGLLNRRTFVDRLRKQLVRARETGRSIGLMITDIDHFKNVNDTLGHAAGDHLLRVLAMRLGAMLPDATIARLGGDEFVIATAAVSGEDDLLAVAGDIIAAADVPIGYAGKPLGTGLSVGCAMYPRDASDVSGMLKNADTALNHVKLAGRGRAQAFTKHMMVEMVEAADALQLAREIIQADRLLPHYQPLVRLSDGKIAGAEALLRWRDRSGELQAPEAIAEAFGNYDLATRIADAMHSRVLHDMACWQRSRIPMTRISINAAPVEFLSGDYAERLLGKLRDFGVPASLLEVEVTEQALGSRGADHVVPALRSLKAAGVRIALDDFGHGASSLAHLLDYPIDVLKIDRLFVARMADSPSIAAIVEAICVLGSRLALDVVAEGIEMPEQAEMLSTWGCRIGQGHLLGAPVPADGIAARFVADAT